MEKYYLETFGCTANVSATELMSYLLTKCGYIKTNEIKNADFVLVNTCVVKAPTESKIKNYLIKLHQDYPLIVAGCLPQVMSNWCKNFIPKSKLIGVDHFNQICLAAKALENNKNFISISQDKSFCSEISRDRINPLTGIIEISKGCNGNCTYCIVKFAKGKLVSKTKNQILDEAKKAINEGCKELWITAQDTASYGEDNLNYSLPQLIKDITSIKENFMIRIGMMNPDSAIKNINELNKLYINPKVYSFAHIPVQSGSNAILKEMKRKYTIEDFKRLVKILRENNNITLSTDIITGFPGETDEDFLKTKSLFQEFKFDIVNISKYGDRPGTLASKSQNKLPTEIVKKRSTEITKIVNKMTLERNKLWKDWSGKAIALNYDKRKNVALLRNKAYKLIAVPKILELGKWYNIEIKKALKTRLIGKLVEKEVKLKR